MIWLVILLALTLIFGFVIAFGAPYLPTLNKQTNEALDLLDLKPGQTLLELGIGDGRVMKAAAERGLKVIGYELNPVLVAISVIKTWRYRKQIRVIWGNYWNKSWPTADGIFVFLLDRYMKKLDKKIVQETSQHVKLVSFAFKIPNKKIVASQNGLFLYHY